MKVFKIIKKIVFLATVSLAVSGCDPVAPTPPTPFNVYNADLTSASNVTAVGTAWNEVELSFDTVASQNYTYYTESEKPNNTNLDWLAAKVQEGRKAVITGNQGKISGIKRKFFDNTETYYVVPYIELNKRYFGSPATGVKSDNKFIDIVITGVRPSENEQSTLLEEINKFCQNWTNTTGPITGIELHNNDTIIASFTIELWKGNSKTNIRVYNSTMIVLTSDTLSNKLLVSTTENLYSVSISQTVAPGWAC